MWDRALISATVMLLIGCFAAAPAHAQNLEAGKSPSQIFAGTCNVCHKSPRGLLRTMPPSALPGFLRQHYTTSPEMAGLLSSYLVSNGAADKRYQGKDAKSDGKPAGQPGGASPQLDRQGRPVHTSAPAREPAKPEAEQQPAAKPDTAGMSPQDDGGRKGRRRLARPAEEGAKPTEDETAIRQSGERGPDGRKLGDKQRVGKRGKPGEEMPTGDAKGEAAKTDSGSETPAASTATREDKPSGEAAKDQGAKPSDETGKVESARETAPKSPAGQTPAMRADPVPAVTPAPAASPTAAAASNATTEPAAGPSAKPAAPSAPPPAQSAASEPAPAPAATSAPSSAPAGPPQPPISR